MPAIGSRQAALQHGVRAAETPLPIEYRGASYWALSPDARIVPLHQSYAGFLNLTQGSATLHPPRRTKMSSASQRLVGPLPQSAFRNKRISQQALANGLLAIQPADSGLPGKSDRLLDSSMRNTIPLESLPKSLTLRFPRPGAMHYHNLNIAERTPFQSTT